VSASETLRDRSIGALLGCALGDAVGELAFRYPVKDELDQVIRRLDTLIYTDDTAMAVVLATQLVEDRAVDPQSLGDRFAAAFAREPWRGYGPGPPKIFEAVQASGRGYPEVARELYGGEGSLGNGAAMRAAPLGVAYRDGPELAAAAERAAEVTHAHPVGRDGGLLAARAVGLALRHALDGRPITPVALAEQLTRGCRTEVLGDKMAAVTRLLGDGAPESEVADAVGRTVAAHESVPFAVYAFLAAPEDFERCLAIAMLNGGDRDTLAAMAGAISGAYLGEDALPERWRARCENRCQLRELARRLAEAFPDAD
jgi:poly(ADP-ribose) glycohydrolase ARH3